MSTKLAPTLRPDWSRATLTDLDSRPMRRTGSSSIR